jgi:hypothetical protein
MGEMMEIYKKLYEVQKQVGKISKDMDNPFYKSKYFDVNKLIEHILPVLQEQKIVLTQPILDGSVSSILTDVESGEQLKSDMELPKGIDPQKMGSAVTYLRRYTLQSLLALQAEDDDGNKASIPQKKVEKKKTVFNKDHPKWQDAIDNLNAGKTTVSKIKEYCILSPEDEEFLKGIEDGTTNRRLV